MMRWKSSSFLNNFNQLVVWRFCEAKLSEEFSFHFQKFQKTFFYLIVCMIQEHNGQIIGTICGVYFSTT